MADARGGHEAERKKTYRVLFSFSFFLGVETANLIDFFPEKISDKKFLEHFISLPRTFNLW
jgi:hypothetical protein